LIVAIQASGGERYLSTPMWTILDDEPLVTEATLLP